MKTRESSFGKAFFKPFCFAKAFMENTLWKKSFVGIAIVLCLLFLAALPATTVAAEQDDFVLDIYGNANEDDTIDMRDYTYTARIILWSEDETVLADANFDGEVNVLDMTQIGLIILGKESELTVIDSADRTVTINMPIERIASSSMPQDIRTIIALGAADKIVGVPDAITGDDADYYPAIYMAYPELTELPIAGSPYYGGPYLEVIASLEPDLVLVSYADADAVQEALGVPTIAAPSSDTVAIALKGFKWLKMMGYIIGEQGRAEELSSYFHDKLDEVRDVTSGIAETEKPKVYLAFWTGGMETITYTPGIYAAVDKAGGMNVVSEDPGTHGPYSPYMWEVSKEQIIAWNPDIILIHACTGPIAIEDVLADPDLQSITAVQNNDVYYTKGFMFGWDPATGVIEASCYMPKLFHSEEFSDLDVDEEGNEILKEVYGADGIWTEMTEVYDLYMWE
jgi:iron complex transport system substrate-binding protein